MPWIYDFDAPPAVDPAALPVLLGGKGANLVAMTRDLGLPVPPGFTITTEACRAYLGGAWPAGLDEELREHVARLGAHVGREFGDPADPLLVSVRSGAPVSMPGMMDTVLDLGLTASSLAGFARRSGSSDFAADCFRRLAEGWRSVIGDAEVPDDPWAQLRLAVEAVFRSWNSDRARAYRQVEGISDDLGTAVTVQAMVFGNRGEDSGTGVLFTRNPSTGEPELYGDFMFNAQGEDVVAGTHATQPISALEDRLPEVGADLRRACRILERHLTDVGDVEFTVEDGRLWLLQVRAGKRSPRAALRMAIDMAEDPEFPLSREEAVRRVLALLADPPRFFVFEGVPPAPITTGLPASPGVASGAIVLSSSDAQSALGPVILIRSETSPEDVAGMAKSAGVLTATGGLASHAAVVARGWGIPAVVGATALQSGAGRVTIAGVEFAAGEVITIDGSTGNVYAGEVAGHWESAPEASTLLAWAQATGIQVAQAHTTTAPGLGGPAAATSREDVLVTLSIKGTTAPDRLEEALLADHAQVEPLVDALIADELAEVADEDIRLTAQGKKAAAELLARDRAKLPEAAQLLDEFHAYDARVKQVVTAWQLREVGGEQTFNDHGDAAYDASVLANLSALHDDAAAWLQPLAARIGRISTYRARLDRALDAARGGDQRFVASPRVDSYHSIWFELHEDLIRLAGKSRTE